MPSARALNLADRVMDATVVPGYTSIGYRVRRRGWIDPDAAALAGADVVVTGASSGLGEEACMQLARSGARVHLVARDRGRGESARERVATGGAVLAPRLWLCDLSELASVRELADRLGAEVGGVRALVHNAGVLPGERRVTAEGFELTFATNVLGPFLLTGLLLERLRAAAPSRVVTVSSGGMYTQRLHADDLQLTRRDFDGAAFYAHTKRIEVVLTELWQRRLGDGVSFHSMHPGWADTPGLAVSLPRFRRLLRPLLRDAAQGADTIAWLCAAPGPRARPGLFWHDRAPRPTHRVPRTRESPEERERLWSELCRLSGWHPPAERDRPTGHASRPASERS